MKASTRNDTRGRSATLFICDVCGRRVRLYTQLCDDIIGLPRNWSEMDGCHYCDDATCRGIAVRAGQRVLGDEEPRT